MGTRLDIALTERHLCQSRSRAKMLITEGRVLVNHQICIKPSELISEEDILELEDIPFVGRGGLKLEGALKQFPVELNGRICLDIGASTGGFTDCMLKHGAKLVYAVDVGHGQLSETLRNHAQVVNLENTDIRNLTSGNFPETPDFCSIDVSFISLKHVLPSAFQLLADQAECIALVKPQFEAGKKALNKQGVVKSEKIRKQVLSEMQIFAVQTGFQVINSCESPIQGGTGNTEYLLYLRKKIS
ncbi:MAG: TlyA family RNA methyltransferase [Oscillospiraceae bacterium]|nr:TlyA family RNA methyltransferase [Oscillospiraceae bacterium]